LSRLNPTNRSEPFLTNISLSHCSSWFSTNWTSTNRLVLSYCCFLSCKFCWKFCSLFTSNVIFSSHHFSSEKHKGFCDTHPVCCTGLHKRHVELVRKRLSFLLWDLALVHHIAFVPYQHLCNRFWSLVVDLFHPLSDVFEGSPITQILHDDNTVLSSQIRHGNLLEHLLSRCVPYF